MQLLSRHPLPDAEPRSGPKRFQPVNADIRDGFFSGKTIEEFADDGTDRRGKLGRADARPVIYLIVHRNCDVFHGSQFSIRFRAVNPGSGEFIFQDAQGVERGGLGSQDKAAK